jgi:hypothetical protein
MDFVFIHENTIMKLVEIVLGRGRGQRENCGRAESKML